MPEGACDSHVHVFEPDRFAFQAERSYTPGKAGVAALQSWQEAAGIDHTVLVQPSVYGTDNRCLLAALESLGQSKARGIVVLGDEDPGDDALKRLDQQGVRGIRLNLEIQGQSSTEHLRARLHRLRWLTRAPGWHLQLHVSLRVVTPVIPDLAGLGVPVVLDHYAGIHKLAQGDPAGFSSVLEFLAQGPGYVKLSAPYRCHASWEPTALQRLAAQLFECAPERALWGSDWPHTGGEAGQPRDPRRTEPFRTMDNASMLGELRQTLGVPGFEQLMVTNPRRLYGFESPDA